jgi:hypothetical protein
MDGRGTYSKKWDQEEEASERGGYTIQQPASKIHVPKSSLWVGLAIFILALFVLFLIILGMSRF